MSHPGVTKMSDRPPRTPGLFYKQLIERPVSVEKDLAIHRRVAFRGFLAATLYSIAYGIYEYFVVYHYVHLMGSVLTEWVNWSLMFGGLLVIVALATRGRVEAMVMGLLALGLLEDVVYWVCQWLDTGIYPFPVPAWWDTIFLSFRVLGLGQPTSFWPYVPVLYYVGFPLLLVYYMAAWKGATSARVLGWLVGPWYLALLAGTFAPDELAAGVILIALPAGLYVYALIALVVKHHQK